MKNKEWRDQKTTFYKRFAHRITFLRMELSQRIGFHLIIYKKTEENQFFETLIPAKEKLLKDRFFLEFQKNGKKLKEKAQRI